MEPCKDGLVFSYMIDDDGIRAVCDSCGFQKLLGFDVSEEGILDTIQQHRERWRKS